MAEPNLIEETNRLLRTILENDAEQRERSKTFQQSLEARKSTHEAEMEKKKAEKMHKILWSHFLVTWHQTDFYFTQEICFLKDIKAVPS